MGRAEKKALAERVKHDQEASRQARHAKRSSNQARVMRACKKAERDFIKRAVRELAAKKKHFTPEGFVQLRAAARAEVLKALHGNDTPREVLTHGQEA